MKKTTIYCSTAIAAQRDVKTTIHGNQMINTGKVGNDFVGGNKTVKYARLIQLNMSFSSLQWRKKFRQIVAD